MAPTTVYVHGNGNKPPEAVLKRQWDAALFGRDMGTASRMAYWAPLRYPQPLPESAPDPAEQLPPAPAAPGPEDVADPEAFIAEVIGQARAEAGRGPSPEAAPADDRLDAWLRDMVYTADALAEGEAAAPGTSTAEALPLPRPLRIAAFRELVRRAFEDVYAYFFGGLMEPMRKVVRDALTGLDGPVVVLGHSLGTIVAYDVLREPDSSALTLPLFVTIGSPLAVTEVQDLVVQPLQVPAAAAAWLNVSDARDLVALDHTVRPEYEPVDRCTDLLVVNDSTSHHGAVEYLQTGPVREAVGEVVGAQP